MSRNPTTATLKPGLIVKEAGRKQRSLFGGATKSIAFETLDRNNDGFIDPKVRTEHRTRGTNIELCGDCNSQPTPPPEQEWSQGVDRSYEVEQVSPHKARTRSVRLAPRPTQLLALLFAGSAHPHFAKEEEEKS